MTKRKISKVFNHLKQHFKFKPVNFRRISLTLAESVDAWRFFPRLIIAMYATLIVWVCTWYFAIPTYQVTHCDPASMKIITDAGIPIKDAIKYTCNVVEVTGGPSMAQTTFVSTIVGMAGLIFGMYTSTGRKWDDGLPNDIDNHPKFKQANENATTPQTEKDNSDPPTSTG